MFKRTISSILIFMALTWGGVKLIEIYSHTIHAGDNARFIRRIQVFTSSGRDYADPTELIDEQWRYICLYHEANDKQFYIEYLDELSEPIRTYSLTRDDGFDDAHSIKSNRCIPHGKAIFAKAKNKFYLVERK